MTRVVVVAARPAVRAGLAALLSEDAAIEIAGEVGSLGGWADGLDEAPVAGDLILIDPSGAAEVEEIAALLPAQPIVVLGPVGDDPRLVAAMAGRAWGYLPRDADGDRLAAVVRAVAGGLVAIDPEIAGRVVGASVATAPADGPVEDLTPREREVLQLIAMGLPNKQIAARLSISEHTVKFHVAAILGRLGAASRTDAVRIGARRGLVVL